MRASAELAPLYRQAARATAAGSRSFYFATRFFPPELARSAHAVYWFCRHTDDLVDECESVTQGRRDLDAWERELLSGRSEHPVLRVFEDAVQRHGIPRDLPRELLAGMRMDLDGTRYETFDELRLFCYRVASVVGLMMSHVIGFREPALEHAVDLGIAMQLTNILRDIGEDYDRGRVYLPREEMAQFGYSERQLAARDRGPEFHRLMRFQVARAREYYRRAEPGIAMLHPGGRFAVKIASDVYREILARVEQGGFDVFDRRAVVPARRKYWITARHCAVRMWQWRPA